VNSFFNKNDLIIIIDDDVCPNNKENFKFKNLPNNIIALVADILELVEDEYEEFTLKDIDEKLGNLGKKLEDFIKYEIPKEFEITKLTKYHPLEISENIIFNNVKNSNAKRNFIVLDLYLEEYEKMELLKKFLLELCKLIPNFYIGIVFYSSNPYPIESLENSKEFLKNKVGLNKEQVEKLSMYINFVNKKSQNILTSFETAFRKSQNFNLISLYNESFSQTIQELEERIWDINNNEALIHYDYLMEGMQLDDIFYEIYQSRFNKIYNEKCFSNYERYINPVRKTIQMYEASKKLEEEEVKKRVFISRSVKELNNLLKQETNLSKCKKSDDIKFGDIFKLNDSYYMIVTQDCDLSIRLLEGRKFNHINLIKVKYSDNQLKNSSIVDKLKDIYKSVYPETTLRKEGLISEIKNQILNNIDTFNKINFNETKINDTFNKDKKDQHFESIVNKMIKVDSDTKFYSIESTLIDCIVLNHEDEDKIKITEENIEKSKEVRLATKKYIKERFKEFIKRYSDIDADFLIEISKKKLISDLIEIEFTFDTNNKLNGFTIEKSKISRIGHLDYIKACDIFKEFISKFSRFSYNNPPLI